MRLWFDHYFLVYPRAQFETQIAHKFRCHIPLSANEIGDPKSKCYYNMDLIVSIGVSFEQLYA